MSIDKPSSDEEIQPSPTMVDQPPTQQTIKAPVSALTTAAAKGRENPYTNPGVGMCYRCGEPEHKSNVCPRRRQINMADYEDEDNVEIETELEDSDFAEEHRESAICVIQQLSCNQKAPDTTQ